MSPKLPRVDCRQLIRALKRAGFEGVQSLLALYVLFCAM
jgi:predicted RNA binding protein YcfA (HicA-like mRNA interferase family)